MFDAGALIAADRGDSRFLALHDELLSAGVVPVVPPECSLRCGVTLRDR